MRSSSEAGASAAYSEDALRLSGSLNNLVCAHDDRLGNGETERLRRLQIDDELEPRRLFDRKVSGFGALENPVDVSCGHHIVFRNHRTIGDQRTFSGHVREIVACRYTSACREGEHFGSMLV